MDLRIIILVRSSRIPAGYFEPTASFCRWTKTFGLHKANSVVGTETFRPLFPASDVRTVPRPMMSIKRQPQPFWSQSVAFASPRQPGRNQGKADRNQRAPEVAGSRAVIYYSGISLLVLCRALSLVH